MRRLFSLLPAALLALIVAAPVAATQTVYNSNGSAITAQGGWESYDETTGRYEFAWLGAWQEHNAAATIDFFGASFQEITCSPAKGKKPAVTEWVETYRYGYGEGTLSVSGRYSAAAAAGTIDVWTDTYNGCTGEYSGTFSPAVAVTLDLVGDGPLVKERGTWSFKIPGEYNDRSSFSVTYRLATGTAEVGGETNDVYGGIGKVTWSSHSNG